MWKKNELFSLDTRSLSLFRILFGLILVLDSVQKLLGARDFYSDWGLLPRAIWISDFMSSWKLSLHLASGETWFQVALLGIQTLAAFAFLVGWRTRWANFVVFVLLCSLQSRNNLILSAADDLIRMALFWSLFLPLSAHFSLDRQKTSAVRVTSLGAIAFVSQLFILYFTTALFKRHPVWLSEGSAIYYALHIDMFVKPLGVYLRDFFSLTQFLTWATLILELFGPFFIFANARLRTMAVATFVAFHLGLYAVFELGFFPWIAIVYWGALVPGTVWASSRGQALERKLENIFSKLKGLLVNVLPAGDETSSEFSISKGVNAVLLVCFTLTLLTNFAAVTKVTLPKPIRAAVYMLYLNQQWDMFAPYPIKNDGWFVAEGTLKDGQTFDLLTEQDVTFEKPKLASMAYKNAFWRKWLLNVWDKSNRDILLPYARYLCRKFSDTETGKPSLTYITLNFMKETTPPPGHRMLPVEKRVLWQHDCFKK